MAKYMVVGAMAQVRGINPADGKPAIGYAYRNAIVDLDAAQAAHLLDVGLVARVADVTDDPTVAAGDASFGLAPPIPLHPAAEADHEEWVAHAIRAGMREEDARQHSRDELAAIYTGQGLQPPAPDGDGEPSGGDDSGDGPRRPARAARREAWVEFRAAQGLPEEVAADMNKEQLQDDELVAGLLQPAAS